MKITIIKGDITTIQCDAIVNAANTSLLGGGGVDGAIHKKAGSQLLEECKTFGGCSTGDAKITSAYNLPAKYVIHAVGPKYINGNYNEPKLLELAYLNSLKFIGTHDIKSIAFPAISTGVYNYPKRAACKIALNTVLEYKVNRNVNIVFVLFDNESYRTYKEEFNKYYE
jgi:O-acetyl-ADP-ribose deacetylase (regulator of RNase III)